MRAAIAWSHNLLTPTEQALFRRLSVFARGCTLEAAETVCNSIGGETIDVLEGLGSLVDKHLVRMAGGVNGMLRASMLETILHRHAGWYLSTAEQAIAQSVSA
jgi:predicted ATPase